MTQRAEFFIKGRPNLAEPYHFKAAGLPGIYLLNGVEFENDPDYGELISIANERGLRRAIGLYIIEKPEPMTGAEFRFLRKQMELTQAELAPLMGVSDQTIANYEKAKTGRLGAADPHLRLLYALHILPPDSRAELLKNLVNKIAQHQPGPKMPDVPRRRLVDGWRTQDLVAA